MTEWKIKRGDQEKSVDDATLQQQARDGRILEGDLVFHPLMQKWMYARELGELSGVYTAKPQVVITQPATSPVTVGCTIMAVIAGVIVVVIVLAVLFTSK
jgi:hypothetical protein